MILFTFIATISHKITAITWLQFYIINFCDATRSTAHVIQPPLPPQYPCHSCFAVCAREHYLLFILLSSRPRRLHCTAYLTLTTPSAFCFVFVSCIFWLVCRHRWHQYVSINVTNFHRRSKVPSSLHFLTMTMTKNDMNDAI